MAIPASVIPAGNSYSVHVAGSDVTSAVTAALLKPHSVDVRLHLTGDDAATQKRRDFLAHAGAKASAFSPAPIPGMPGEGFWKTTLAVVQASGSSDFWWPPRADKKVEWDCLLVALFDGAKARAGIRLENLPEAQVCAADLWIVSTAGDATEEAETWLARGAGAVAVLGPAGTAWASANASFGNARGARVFDLPLATEALDPYAFGCFTGGVTAGLIEELLGENLFDKGIVRVERDELEARPLHVARACALGGAAARASQEEGPERLLQKSGDLIGRVRALLRADRPEGEPKPWGSKGR